MGTTRMIEQQDRDRGGERPVAVREELAPELPADHQGLRAAEQIRDHELADRRDEAQERAGDDARHGERHGDRPERAPGRRAEIQRRLEQRVVHLLQRRVERQHHEGQIGVDDADIDRRLGVEDVEGLGDQAEAHERLVQQALRLQDRDPGIDADEEARPERQDDQAPPGASDSAPARAPCHRRWGSRRAAAAASRRRRCARDESVAPK